MSFVRLLLAAGSFTQIVLAAPHGASASAHQLSKRSTDHYRMYVGTADAPVWPVANEWWDTFDDMFKGNIEVIRNGCSQFHVPNNSDQEIATIFTATGDIGREVGMDPRFILAIMLEESNACVRAPTTNNGVRNPGVMQSHNGAGTCNDGHVQSPCPKDAIYQMIRDGVQGTAYGDGLRQLVSKAPGPADNKYFAAARMYNSGSIDPSGHLENGVATHCYVSDVANRLRGWVRAQKNCHLDGAPPPALSHYPDTSNYDMSFIPGFGGKSAAPTPAPAAAPEPAPAPVPVPVPAPAHVSKAPEPEPAPAPASVPIPEPVHVEQPSKPQAAFSNMRAPGVTTECAKYYLVQHGDFCLKVGEMFGISFEILRQMNVALDEQCSNLWLGYDYCVQPL
ncbi:hypothetical protein BT63DRAFT_60689 [Microthyrium microscopicum]|uniref:LysM domain-containing protein n=1 Tax=Microthyrium microscopicum TaxID=703497 RepID=A0A6A6U0W1_9PEZI|nr:hypothetical protein BT63DRAFT_60689 [Microthyrium microscopicum]